MKNKERIEALESELRKLESELCRLKGGLFAADAKVNNLIRWSVPLEKRIEVLENVQVIRRFTIEELKQLDNRENKLTKEERQYKRFLYRIKKYVKIGNDVVFTKVSNEVHEKLTALGLLSTVKYTEGGMVVTYHLRDIWSEYTEWKLHIVHALRGYYKGAVIHLPFVNLHPITRMILEEAGVAITDSEKYKKSGLITFEIGKIDLEKL